MSEAPFMDRLLAGEVLDLDEIERDIARWHEHPNPTVELHDWLGLTPEEYALFAERPDTLRLIAHARRQGVDLRALLNSEQSNEALSAREWLKRSNRL